MVQEKVYQARAWLARKYPFLASGLFALPVREAPDELTRTAAVDDRGRLWVNPQFFEKLSVQEAGTVLYHELLHILLDHFSRRGERDPQAWNVAADLEINDNLLAEGLPLPKGALIPGQEPFEDFPKDLLAEEYFEKLPEQGKGAGVGGQGQDQAPGAMIPSPDGSGADGLSESELEVVKRQVAQAVQEAAARNPGSVPGNLERWARGILDPKVPWNRILASLVRGAVLRARGRQDYRLDGRNRRQAVSAAVLPRLRAPEPRVLVLIDTSGSVSDEELALVLGEIRGLVRTLGIGVDVASGDTELQTFERGVLDPSRIRLRGGGGTALGEVLAQLREKGRWDLAVVLTDGWSSWPQENPLAPIPVVVVTWDREGPDWARTVKVEK